MRVLTTVILIIIILGLAGLGYTIIYASISEDQARQLFESSGCTGCHNGGIAPDFAGTIEKIKTWASKYNTLDEAVASEAPSFSMFNNVKTWDELMNSMPGITPELTDFFTNIFTQSKTTTTTTTQETTTTTKTTTTTTQQTTTTTETTETTTITTTKTAETSKLPEVEVPNPSQESEPLVKRSFLVGVGLFVIALIALTIAIMIFRRGYT
ncbi:MAG: hypothetical protein F7C81_02045 [Desulfurococcales archaeon]|nr:hypothetical protein [Desulfurococcales archaeon]